MNGLPRTMACHEPQTFHLFTDAASEDRFSGLGGILYNDKGMIVNWFSEAVPPTVLASLNSENKKGFIYELEACAAVQGVIQLCRKLKNHHVILYCDNEAALSALIRCRSESTLVASQLSKLSEFEDEACLNIWFERVASEANPADGPSRRHNDGLPTWLQISWSVESLLG